MACSVGCMPRPSDERDADPTHASFSRLQIRKRTDAFRFTMTEIRMRINSSVIALAAALALAISSISRAQVADAGRVAVTRERAFPADTLPRDTSAAAHATDIRSGPPIAKGGAIGALIGVAITYAAIESCNRQPQKGDMGNWCALAIVTVGPAAVGGGALLGGFVGWLVARSEREGAR